MLTNPLTVLPVERKPAAWILSATVALTGSCEIGFTSTGAEPTASTTWYSATWADTDPTLSTRTTQTVVAGSAVAEAGDAFPGIGDYTAWVRYTDLDGMIRVTSGGVVRFR